MRLPLVRLLVLAAVLLGLTACGGGGGGGHQQPAVPNSISIVSGDAQSGSVGAELPAALAVRVTDSAARPVSGATVTWVVTAGGGTVTPTTGTTDSSGTTSSRWRLGPLPGANQVTATVAGGRSVTFNATGAAAATASVTVTSPVREDLRG